MENIKENPENIREFPNSIAQRAKDIEIIADYLHEFKYKALDQEPEPCWMNCQYRDQAERLYELLGGYDATTLFIRQLQLVDPSLLLKLTEDKDNVS